MLLFVSVGCAGAQSDDGRAPAATQSSTNEAETSDSTTDDTTSGKETEEVINDPDGDDMAGDLSETGSDEGEESMTEDSVEDVMLQLSIGQEAVNVAWEDNETVEALKELARSGSLTVNMSMYGGFEQVGSLGTSLPKNDVQTTTQAGDIVLYSGNQIVIFYGSNSWAYTRLGHITDKDASELADLLGNGDVAITIYTE